MVSVGKGTMFFLNSASFKAKKQLKAAVTMPSIDERAAYAHFHEPRKHIASFCGTGNNAQFLSDPTGNQTPALDQAMAVSVVSNACFECKR